MSSLPFISHHLFVAAVAQETPAQHQPRGQESLVNQENEAVVIPLQLLEASRSEPPGRVRPLNVSSVARGR